MLWKKLLGFRNLQEKLEKVIDFIIAISKSDLKSKIQITTGSWLPFLYVAYKYVEYLQISLRLLHKFQRLLLLVGLLVKKEELTRF